MFFALRTAFLFAYEGLGRLVSLPMVITAALASACESYRACDMVATPLWGASNVASVIIQPFPELRCNGQCPPPAVSGSRPGVFQQGFASTCRERRWAAHRCSPAGPAVARAISQALGAELGWLSCFA